MHRQLCAIRRSRYFTIIWTVLLQCGIASSSDQLTAIFVAKQPAASPPSNDAHYPRRTNSSRLQRRRGSKLEQPHRLFMKEQHHPVNKQSLRSSFLGASESNLTFTPGEDASIFQNKPDESNVQSNGPWLFFQGGGGGDGVADYIGDNDGPSEAHSNKIESLILFDLEFLGHRGTHDLSSAELHLCKSLSEGGPFDPDGLTIQSTPSKGDSDGVVWNEGVTWNNAPSPKEEVATASFRNSYTDQPCRYDVYDVTSMLKLNLHSSNYYLSLRIGSNYEFMGMYASKEYKGGSYAPRLEVYFTEDNSDEEGSNTSILSNANDNIKSSDSAAISTGNGTVMKGCAYLGQRIDDYSRGMNYQERMLVTDNKKVYECKVYPYSGWCKDYEPGSESSQLWKDAWLVLGNCTEIIYSVPTMMADGCAIRPFEVGYTYQAHDQVSYQNMVYECKPSTSSMWCGMQGYAPGVGAHWNAAWQKTDLKVEPCDKGSILDSSSGASITVSSVPTMADGCAIRPFEVENSYQANDRVSHQSIVYECKPAPASSWCKMKAYQPVLGSHWDMAWERTDLKVGHCDKLDGSSGANIKGGSSGVVAPSSIQPGRCEPLYNNQHSYNTHDRISHENHNYTCLVAWWCNQLLWAPYVGNDISRFAWRRSPALCHGEPLKRQLPPLPTSEPTKVPMHEPTTDELIFTPTEEPTKTHKKMLGLKTETSKEAASKLAQRPNNPTLSPSPRPTPTPRPSFAPINQPTKLEQQSQILTLEPLTQRPSRPPTRAPLTRWPNLAPTNEPTQLEQQSQLLTLEPLTQRPSRPPTRAPPTRRPSLAPTKEPTQLEQKSQVLTQLVPLTPRPSLSPTRAPLTRRPSFAPTKKPTQLEQKSQILTQLVPLTPRPSRSPTRAPRTSRPTKELPLPDNGGDSSPKWFGVSVDKKNDGK